MDKLCEGNIFYDEINPTICDPISIEFKHEICKGNATQETIPYHFNGKWTSATLLASAEGAGHIALDTSTLH